MVGIKFIKKPWLRKRDRLVYSPHFWAIFLIIAFLTIFYYETYIFGYRVFSFFWYVQATEFNYNAIGSLFCIPLVYAALVFWWRGVLITWLISMAVILPQILTFRSDLVSHFTNIFYLLIPLLIVIFVSLELNWRDKARKGLAEREVERQNYISQVFKAQEDERKRISQEIHDDSIQRLAGVATITQMLSQDKKLAELPLLKQRAESIRDIIISISQDLRRLSIGLRPTVLDDLGLVPAVYWLVDNFKQESGINARVDIIGDNQNVNKKITVLIFRIVQEALNNAKRYSKATDVRVTLVFTNKIIRATIKDNGQGFEIPRDYEALMMQEGKLGLIGVQQRTQALNGTINIHSEMGRGTTISVEVGL
jgi:signal transduction histidine kinase